ncbi:MAG TPA: hypothetical protein VNJ70_03080 [Thermoanaerobaculia bacterium]|nr:hypothetical protein [Thermoanaerobaculia bacterium]
MSSSRRFAFRWAVIAFTAHAIVVVALSAVHNLGWSKLSFAWEAGHLLRAVDLPVYWAIEHSARQITYLPSWLAILGVHWISLILEGSFHVVIGGAFYALLAAAAALLISRRRQQQATGHGIAEPETEA